MILAIWIGWTRLYVGVHFPTDVLAGAAIGIFSAWAAGKIIEAAIKKWTEKQKNASGEETHE